MTETVTRVIALANRHIPGGGTLSVHDLDVELVGLGFGSLRTVAFMVDVEEAFEISFPPHLITADTFRTLRSIVDAVTALGPTC
ncbi:phosphopantetheine-binding protein [Longispora urticae]